MAKVEMDLSELDKLRQDRLDAMKKKEKGFFKKLFNL